MRILAPALYLFAALCAPSLVAAQPASELGAPRPSKPARARGVELQYSDVDRGTVRVFSLRHVDLTRLQGKRLMRDVAEPVAGHGSGFFVGERGLVVTAEHVVRGRSHVAVHAFGESDPRPAKVVYLDAKADLAILQTLGPDRAPIAIPDEPPSLRVRDRVHAVGYPIDAARMDPQSSDGILAGVLPDGRLQLSISVNPGNSGGPLVDTDERLIGMIIARGNVERGVHGIGVAVPLPKIVEAVALVERLGAGTRVAAELERDRASAMAIADTVDALVSEVAPRALREAWEAEASSAPLEALERLERLAVTATDPDLAAMLAAFFWNASLLAMERAGGYASPTHMPEGSSRELSFRTLRLAVELCHRANDKDSSLASRSPFVRHVIRAHPRRKTTAASARAASRAGR